MTVTTESIQKLAEEVVKEAMPEGFERSDSSAFYGYVNLLKENLVNDHDIEVLGADDHTKKLLKQDFDRILESKK
ncbi:hypothetical protein [Peribacillus kribbensis]|uniref:hypothetical protein n=1 Tax=Peribacillus kribbensis TaxID=356658 RepID=UPI0004296EA9|nr:hypothetical protein [Peribacillus kribbensis]